MSDQNDRKLIQEALHLAAIQYGGHVRGARFKVLIRQIDPSFDEKRLGFPNLKAFLAAYPDVVRVIHDGLDIVPLPASEARETTANGQALKNTPRIHVVRPDVWRAFTLVDSTVIRNYDKHDKCAVMLPRDTIEDEPERLREQRRLIAENPDRFVPITPVTPTEQMSQMRSFVSELQTDNPIRASLDAALQETLWFRKFTAALKANANVELAWKVRWSEFVLSQIREWMTAHELDIPDLVTRTVPARVAASYRVPVAEARTDFRHTVSQRPAGARERVLQALQRMPTSWLMALPIPAEYLLDDGDW